MIRPYQQFYWVKGQAFENTNNRMNGMGKAVNYCKENGIDTSEIYTLNNNSELAFLQDLLNRDDIVELNCHKPVDLLKEFTNYNNEKLPTISIVPSFDYVIDKEPYRHYVKVINTPKELTREFLILKRLFDFNSREFGYLEIYYLDDDGLWREWTYGDNSLFINQRKKDHKQTLFEKKKLRDMQKFDRLLKLREQGKITERQLQELYRLEKVFKNDDIN